jgi:C-terminal processing protease CtpA/Prc
LPDGAAAKVGLQSGDVIIEFNGKDIRDIPFEDIDIRGQAGEVIHVGVVREGAEGILYFEIVRQAVNNS